MTLLAANIYSVGVAGVIVGGLVFLGCMILLTIIAYEREERNRPLVPWGARMRVEREKARLELDAIEVKRLAVEALRNQTLQAVKDDDLAKVKELTALSSVAADSFS